jgi:serine/threonine-protein kinase
MVCPGCQTVYEAETNYCGRCGQDLRGLWTTKPHARISSPGPQGATATAPAPAKEVDPWLNRVVDSRYRVHARLGQGGMGVVYKVEHQRMGKIAAMKVLHRDLAADREVVKRFRREAEAVSKLTHPNTVQTFDFGTFDGALYLVMEYVRGEDLGSIVRRDGALPWRRAAPILVQICGALGEAHELGIVHRDLKPENILVTRTKEGRDHVKVLDFGLAKLSEREEAAEVTGRGSIVGTPYYMSPEQIRGEALDHRLRQLGPLSRQFRGRQLFCQPWRPRLRGHAREPPASRAARDPASAGDRRLSRRAVQAGGPSSRPEHRDAGRQALRRSGMARRRRAGDGEPVGLGRPAGGPGA